MRRKIRRGELYYADLNPVVGSEQGGERPVLIIQNNIGNKHSPTAVVVAITSKLCKSNLPTHVKLNFSKLPKNSMALLEQIRTIDKRRISMYIGKLSQEEMEMIESALLLSVGMKRRKDDDT